MAVLVTWIEFESVSAFHHSYTLWPLISNFYFDIGKFCFYILIPFDPFWPYVVLWIFWNELISFDLLMTSDCSLNFWNELRRFFSLLFLPKKFPLVLKNPVVFLPHLDQKTMWAIVIILHPYLALVSYIDVFIS